MKVLHIFCLFGVISFGSCFNDDRRRFTSNNNRDPGFERSGRTQPFKGSSQKPRDHSRDPYLSCTFVDFKTSGPAIPDSCDVVPAVGFSSWFARECKAQPEELLRKDYREDGIYFCVKGPARFDMQMGGGTATFVLQEDLRSDDVTDFAWRYVATRSCAVTGCYIIDILIVGRANDIDCLIAVQDNTLKVLTDRCYPTNDDRRWFHEIDPKEESLVHVHAIRFNDFVGYGYEWSAVFTLCSDATCEKRVVAVDKVDRPLLPITLTTRLRRAANPIRG